MNLTIELLENLIALGPAAISLLLVCRQPSQIASWVLWVLGTSAIAVVALGLLLKRLTSTCPDSIPLCESPLVVMHRIPGIFNSCVQCGSEPATGVSRSLNQFAMPLQAGVAAVCILISFTTTIRFIVWASKALSTPRQ